MDYKEGVKKARKIMTQELKPKWMPSLTWTNTAEQVVKDVREFGYDTVTRIHKNIPTPVLQRIARMAIMIEKNEDR